jgi:hypothetical protein
VSERIDKALTIIEGLPADEREVVMSAILDLIFEKTGKSAQAVKERADDLSQVCQ